MKMTNDGRTNETGLSMSTPGNSIRRSMASREDSSPRRMCYRCRRPLDFCLCAGIRPFPTRTRFLLLTHPKEARKQKTGTGRLSHLCLSNSRIITGIDFTEHPEVNRLLELRSHLPVLLYPGPGGQKISASDFSFFKDDARPLLAVALDGTWTLAKKMLKLSRNLQALPRLSLDVPQGSRFHIKQQPHAACLSTIESLYHFLDALDTAGIEDCRGRHLNLLETLNALCLRQASCVNDPRLPGYRKGRSPSAARTHASIRPQKRNIFFP